MTTKAELMALLDQRDALDVQIEKATADLKLDAKGVREIRRAAAKLAAAQKTLGELMGIDPATAAKVAAEGDK